MSNGKEVAIIDKSKWGDGPWQAEPDRAEWEYAGFPCLAVRHSRSGHWCGYVGVPPNHPLHGKSYDVPNVAIHGGLTYAAACDGHVCHVPKAGEPENVWWFGFDCQHSGDLAPGTPKEFRLYEDWDYMTLLRVQNETNRLAEQLKEHV